MAGGIDPRVSDRPVRIYGVRDAFRDELREMPLRPRDVLAILIGFPLVLVAVVLFLATGSQA